MAKFSGHCMLPCNFPGKVPILYFVEVSQVEIGVFRSSPGGMFRKPAEHNSSAFSKHVIWKSVENVHRQTSELVDWENKNQRSLNTERTI